MSDYIINILVTYIKDNRIFQMMIDDTTWDGVINEFVYMTKLQPNHITKLEIQPLILIHRGRENNTK